MFSSGLIVSVFAQSTPAVGGGMTDTLAALSAPAGTVVPPADSIAPTASMAPDLPADAGKGAFDLMLSSLPTDPASIFALLLLVGCTILVLRYGLQKGGSEKKGTNAGSAEGRGETQRS